MLMSATWSHAGSFRRKAPRRKRPATLAEWVGYLAWWSPWSTPGTSQEEQEIERVVVYLEGASRRVAVCSLLSLPWWCPGPSEALEIWVSSFWCTRANRDPCQCRLWLIPWLWVFVCMWPFVASEVAQWVMRDPTTEIDIKD